MKRAVPPCCLAVAVAVVLAPPGAGAHHGADENGLGIPQPLSMVGLQVEGGEFRLPEGAGRYLTTSLRMDYAPSQAFSFGLRIPFHILEVQDAGRRTGLGDLTLVIKAALASLPDGIITLGLATSLPTGSPDAGLGDGHLELYPYLRANLFFDILTVQLSLGDSITIVPRGNEEHVHASFIDPHSDHELRYQLGFGVSLFKQLQLVAVGNGVTVLERARAGETLLTVGPQLRWSPTPYWQLTGGAQLPVFGPRRAEWRANVALQTLF